MSGAAASEAAFAYKDWITLSGIALSFGLGIYNLVTTKNLRRGTIRLEEFRSQVRDPIAAAIKELMGQRELANALTKPSADDVAAIRSKVIELMPKAETAALGLLFALQAADRSEFANGDDWAALASPVLDQFTAELEAASAQALQTPEEVRAKLRTAITRLDDAIGIARAQIETEVKRHLP